MTATHTHYTTLANRLRQAVDTVAAQIAAGPLSDLDSHQLASDDGLQVDGCAVWLVGNELRSFTCCTCCGNYAELAVGL